jgi:hypothetical protein
MELSPEGLKKETLLTNFDYHGFLPLGSWGIKVYGTKKYYIQTLGHHFKQKITANKIQKQANANLYMIESSKDSYIFRIQSIMPDTTIAQWKYFKGGIAALATGRFQVFIFKDDFPPKIVIFIGEPQYSYMAFEGHLFEIMHKILFMFDRLYIHAAAVRWNDKIFAFLGDRGSGKSTVCLRLAKAGAQILSDDHIMLKRSNEGVLVSGCDEIGRVTSKTEKELLNISLNKKPKRFNGVLKKEILLNKFFECAHYQDFLVNDIFFIHIDDIFQISPISKQQALINLIEKTKPFFRYNRIEDCSDYLIFFSELVNQTRVFDLTLTKNLKDLDKLLFFLDTR